MTIHFTHILRTSSPALLGLILLVLFSLAGCSSTKSVPQGDYLYIGGDITVKSEYPETATKDLEGELQEAIRPQPNSSFLGMRPKLWIYNAFGGNKENKGIAKWIKTRLGQPPVLLSEAYPEKVQGQMANRLYNLGYFNPAIAYEVDSTSKKKMASVHYTATVQKQYTIQKIQFPQEQDSISERIRATEPNSLLKVGDPYNLQTLIAERLRINEVLKEEGYFFFDENYLVFHVDSTQNNKVDVYVRIKREAPNKALIPYRYNQVTIYSDFASGDTLDPQAPPVQYENYKYYPDEETFKARAILNAVFITNDDYYSRKKHLQTINRLMDLGTFKFAEVRFTPLDSVGRNGLLNADILLTQAKKKSLQAEVLMVTKSNGYAGPGIRINFRNRNALRGAELLMLNLIGSIESQSGGGAPERSSNLTSFELGADAEMHIPRIISPFDIRISNSMYQPRTRFMLGFRFIDRREFFQQNSFTFEYGYNWRQRATTQIYINPVQVQLSRLGSVTPEFEKILEDRPFLARSFDQQFIIGGNYRFVYNSQGVAGKKHQFYISPGLDMSGGLWGLIFRVKNGRPADPDFPNTLNGQAISQYVKTDLETRYYFNITDKLVLATRFIGGYGLPYGNSRVLPYIKQYGAGGPNSIRAFAARSIGPGTYDPTSVTREGGVAPAFSFFDQVGDIRLEGNAEFRFPLMDPYLKGAVFVDAGNIWLVNEDPDRPGGQFSGNFLNELAVGAGAGLRIDVQFFVIRLDLAYPLRDPNYADRPTSGLFGSGVLNLAIGYPF
ncbi:translocation and assembly module lipoprotein TamL [Rufibacter roseus]|uniref:BamA/TamA family outer membrane protein n=1 Tax=Rufibacter roseus TaxID=1567108 RepID=A0ABW2DJJ1_9BACT|nr:BamA/TamA family outer membrane protein [Rufibacter roseus]